MARLSRVGSSTWSFDVVSIDPQANVRALVVYFLLLVVVTSCALWLLTVRDTTGKSLWREAAPVTPPKVHDSIYSSVRLMLKLARDPLDTVLNSEWLNRTDPVRLPWLFTNVYANQGPKNVAALFRNKSLSAAFIHGRVLYWFFGGSLGALRAYTGDNSGHGSTPLSGTIVKENNRLDYKTFLWHHRFLTGAGLAPLCKQYQKCFSKHFESFHSQVRDGWVHHDDIMDVFKHSLVGPALVETLVGPTLLKLTPDFLDHYWVLHDDFWALANPCGKWSVRKPHLALKQCLAAIRAWHSWSAVHCPEVTSTTSDGIVECFWGSRFIRERHRILASVAGITQGDIESHDLAFLWAATHNTITSIFWLVVDIFQDPRVLHHIREEVESCLLVNGSDDIPPVFDMNRLQQQPYVQAAYAEILRLRTHGTILRKPRDNIVINDWFMPKDSLIATCSTTAHMNAAVWSSPERGSRPVFEFYPDRFLAHDPDRAEPQFTMAGTDGAWIPFAGGVRTCPGRHFAKYEIILTLAVLMKMYDIEILVKPGSANLQMSSYRFGLGVLEPKGKVPFRIRSR